MSPEAEGGGNGGIDQDLCIIMNTCRLFLMFIDVDLFVSETFSYLSFGMHFVKPIWLMPSRTWP